MYIEMSSRLDIVIFGATGFTGKRTVPELSKLIKSENLPLTWGVAGRSESKLRAVLAEAEKRNEDDFSNIPVFVADINDEKSLLQMTAQAKVVINTIGPFRFHGESVVKACLETCTHHIDVSGEPEFNENIQLKYHEEAKRKGIYLISSCGIDSVPADMGAIFMSNIFNGTLNSIVTYLYTTDSGNSYPGPVLNYTTWVSAVHGVSNYKQLKKIRTKLFSEKLPPCKPKLMSKGILSKSETIGRWILLFPGADHSVMRRTQRYLYEMNKQRPIQIECYQGFEKFHNALFAIFIGIIFKMMCKYNWTRSLLIKNPKLFSIGTFTLEGPSEEKQNNTNFHILLEGEGWEEKLLQSTDEFITPPNKKMLVEVSGKNPGYGATCTTIVLCAIMILTENENMPKSGGCYSPGYAFANTTLIQKLNNYGINFKIKSKL